MKKHHKKRNLRKKTTAVIYLTMMLTPQVSQFTQIAKASPFTAPVQQITLPSNQKINLNLGNGYQYKAQQSNGNIIKVSTEAGNTLNIEPLKEGSTFLTLEVSDKGRTIVQSFIINVVATGTDGVLDVGDIVNYLHAYPSNAIVTDVRKMLEGIDSRIFTPSHTYATNLSPVALSQPMFIFDPNQETFVQSVIDVQNSFMDPNGDYLSFTIIQNPDPLSGLSLNLYGDRLYAGGTPTVPTEFTVRAMDPQGLYADTKATLNFVPEALSHAVIQANGLLNQINLYEYFTDRDNDPLSFSLNGYFENHNHVNAWIEDDILSISGIIAFPLSLQISATDGHGWQAYNQVMLYSESLAPIAKSQPMVIFDPHQGTFVQSVLYLQNSFMEPNGDYLSFSIIQTPDPLSGLSLNLHDDLLYAGGTPTLPTEFKIRATDTDGLYTDVTGRLNFVPEPVSHAVIQSSGLLNQINLNEYFTDRDNDPLSFSLNGYFENHNYVNTWIEGDILSISGMIAFPLSLQISATDGHGWKVYNTVSMESKNFAPVASSQTMVAYDPNMKRFALKPFWYLDDYFIDPNGDSLSYSIVQRPDPLSGLSILLYHGYNYLAIGGSPTIPTKFTIRATDQGGLYTDVTGTLNFGPEAVSHAVTQSSGKLTQINLNEYFTDRDNDPLYFSLDGHNYNADNTDVWLQGEVLSISGTIIHPLSLLVAATDRHGFYSYNSVKVQGENLAPLTLSQPIVFFDPNYNSYMQSFFDLRYSFKDPNGDMLSYSIVQGPDPLSGMSLNLNANYLSFGGTPTAPTTFTIRATDPQGLYTDMISTLNFVPEALSHAVIQSSGMLTQINLNEYFIDRDNESLSFSLNGYDYNGDNINAWIQGDLLSISGAIAHPLSLQVSATDGHWYWSYNSVKVQGENLAPLTLSQPIVFFDPNYDSYMQSFFDLRYSFKDPNGDMLSYSIVQGPDPLSGLSLNLYAKYLSFGGTPTAPTTFTIRATDPQGLYTDMISTLNFVPEALSHAVVQSSGVLTQINLNEYFTDRDNESLCFSLNGYDYNGDNINAWIQGDLLSISGAIVHPLTLQVSATDGHWYWSYNSVKVQGENLAPLTLSQPIVSFDPNYDSYMQSFFDLRYSFKDPNGDMLSYSIVQGPDPLSGMSLNLYANYLSFGGTPTAPTTFTIRATDPQGLYTDMISTLNFVPEALSHAVIQSSGMLTQINLNEYFTDRDNEPLSFVLNGNYSHSVNAWIEGNILSISGIISSSLVFGIWAFEDAGRYAINYIKVK